MLFRHGICDGFENGIDALARLRRDHEVEETLGFGNLRNVRFRNLPIAYPVDLVSNQCNHDVLPRSFTHLANPGQRALRAVERIPLRDVCDRWERCARG